MKKLSLLILILVYVLNSCSLFTPEPPKSYVLTLVFNKDTTEEYVVEERSHYTLPEAEIENDTFYSWIYASGQTASQDFTMPSSDCILYAIGENAPERFFNFDVENSSLTSGSLNALTSKGVLVLPEAFLDCPILKIENKAFYNFSRNLTAVSIPEGIETIGDNAFAENYYLHSVSLPSTLKHIGDRAFYESRIEGDLVIPEGVTYLGDKCFGENTGLRSIIIPDTVQYIGKDLFQNCWLLDQVVLPKGMKSIPDGMFFDCLRLKVDFLNGIESIGRSAFGYLRTNKLVIPLSVQSIGAYAFEHASISSFEYEGTMDEWNNIELGQFWNVSTNFSEVKCSDGSIPL